MSYFDRDYRPYVTAASRRLKAERELKKLAKKGREPSPVVITGRTIARTFWGKAWCDNLEGYSDYSNRLPRGRTYARNGSVIDLRIGPGEVKALVSGSAVYRVSVKVAAVPKSHWASICTDCAGTIDSLVELLQGRFSKAVMERVCRRSAGLFPTPGEIEFSCSCPDWASLCKHIAAVLYGIGARLDEEPALLFALRKVDEKDLLAGAGKGAPLSKMAPAGDRILADDGLSELFGLEMGAEENGDVLATAGTAGSRSAVSRRAVTLAKEVKPARKRPAGKLAKSVSPARERPAGKLAKDVTPARKRPAVKASTEVKAARKRGAGNVSSATKKPAKPHAPRPSPPTATKVVKPEPAPRKKVAVKKMTGKR